MRCVNLIEMIDSPKRPKLVGSFIRQRRESLGISQRALGQLFEPAVTTQFISNLERGVTPLPPNHIGTLSRALQVPEAELTGLLEREYAAKLSGRLGKPMETAPLTHSTTEAAAPHLPVSSQDYAFMKTLYDAFRVADRKTRITFATVCESILNLPKMTPPGGIPGGPPPNSDS